MRLYNNSTFLNTLENIKNNHINLIDFLNTICDNISKKDAILNAFIPESNRKSRLIEEAKQLIKKHPHPSNRPLLFGLPIGIKDIFNVSGLPTQCGSKLPPEIFIGDEAQIVTLLKEHGALIVGKTVTTEFAYFTPGPTKNPYNTDYTPGGSSSGSAAAVGAGFIPLALGTQTIGSITRPAAFCGTIGVKPSYNSISTKGVFPFAKSFDHIGFFCPDLDLAKLVASLICKEFKSNETIFKETYPTIGLPHTNFLKQADNNILHTFNILISNLKQKEFKVIETNLFENIDTINHAHRQIAAKEFSETHKDLFNTHAHLYSMHSKNLIKQGLSVSKKEAETYLSLIDTTKLYLKDIMLKNNIDIWLSPSTTSLPPLGLESTGSPLMNLPWTFTGVPSISLPYIDSTFNLPYGLQFCGTYNGLSKLFSDVDFIKKRI